MNSKIVTFALIGLLAGVLIGEFFPGEASDSLSKDLGAAFSRPFSEYRNELALKYGLIGAVIGALVGLIASRRHL